MNHLVIVRAIVVVLLVSSLIGCGVQPTAPISESPIETPNSATDLATVSPLASVTSSPAAVNLPGRIFFTRAGGQYGDETIFSANADGSQERQLTKPDAYCCQRVSPDGTRLLVMTEDQPTTGPITGGTIGVDGSPFVRLPLTDPTLNLVPQAWSPDGTRIAFEGWDDSDPSRNGVYTARYSDGSDVVRLSSVSRVHDIPSDYSPDGKWIVFFRAAAEADTEGWDIGGSLWVVDSDGNNARQIETGKVVPSWWARWSPDGSKILFATARAQASGALWTVNPDGSNLAKIFEDPEGRFPITPTWSPDGRQVMFALDPIADEFRHPANAIYIINADGTGLTQVLGGSDFKRRMEWKP